MTARKTQYNVGIDRYSGLCEQVYGVLDSLCMGEASHQVRVHGNLYSLQRGLESVFLDRMHVRVKLMNQHHYYRNDDK